MAGYIDTEVASILSAVDTEVAAIKAKTDNLPAAPAAVSDIPTAAAVADAVWDEALSGHLGAGSTGEALNGAGAAGDPWTTALPGAYGAGSAGNIVGTLLDAAISSRASQTSVNTVDDLLDTEVAAIKAVVDAIEVDTQDIQSRIPAALVSGRMDASVGAMAANTLTASALAADAVTEIQSGLATAAALDAVDNFIDTEIGTILTNLATVDTVVDAIQAKTDNLPTDPADASVVAGLIAAVEAKVDTVDTVVDAVKAKTDSLTFTVAGQVDANIQSINDVTVNGDGAATPWGP